MHSQEEESMTGREVIRMVLEGRQPPYVPWSLGFTHEAAAKLRNYYGQDDLEPYLDNHLLVWETGLVFS